MIHRFRRAALASSIAVLSATALVACSDGDGDDDGTGTPITVPTTGVGTPPDDTGAPPSGDGTPAIDTGVPSPGTGMPPDETDVPPVGTGEPPDGGGEPPTDTEAPPTAVALTEDDLEGSWSTGCLLDDPDDPDSEYESASISFDDGEFEFASDSFSDAGCTESLGEDAELEGSFSLGGTVVTSGGLATTAIDLAVSEEDGGDAVTVLDLVLLEGDVLYFANGDFGELEDVVGQPRPDALELDEPYARQDDDDTTPAEGMPPGGVALTEDDLEGSWSTGCLLDDPDEADSEYESASITFDDEEFEFESDSYRDAGCTESLGEDVELEGTFTLGRSVTTEDGLEATEIDLVAREEDEDESVTVLDLVYLDGDTLYFADGDFDELEELAGQPRPSDLELDEPYRRR